MLEKIKLKMKTKKRKEKKEQQLKIMFFFLNTYYEKAVSVLNGKKMAHTKYCLGLKYLINQTYI